MKVRNYSIYTWLVLGFNIIVILWGVYVRATGSGAGCGSHWPLCNGVVIPQSEQSATLIEFTHRVTSGIAFLLVVGLYIGAFIIHPAKSPVRKGAVASLVFIITEALVGAGLVLFEWVAQDQSLGRIISMAVHLINTFLLLGALALTAWWASGGAPIKIKGTSNIFWVLMAGYLGLIILGVSGAITALGDTLFPAATLMEGFQQDFSTTSHFLIRLRVWHPIIAILVSSYIFVFTLLTGLSSLNKDHKFFSKLLFAFLLIQLIAGLVNVVLKAPIFMQLIHLFLADSVWIILVLYGAVMLAGIDVGKEANLPVSMSDSFNNKIRLS